jgi:hypothetical protein
MVILASILFNVMMLVSIVSIITYIQISRKNNTSIAFPSHRMNRNFWVVTVLATTLLATIIVAIFSGALSAFPFLDDANTSSGEIRGLIQIFNIILGIVSIAYIGLILCITVVAIIGAVQLALLIYCCICLKNKLYIKKIYRVGLLVISIVVILGIFGLACNLGALFTAF